MKLPNKINPALAASKDSTRYILQHVRVTNQLAMATDGRRLLVTCVERDEVDPENVDILVPAKAVNAACAKKRRHLSGQLRISDQAVTIEELGESTTYSCTCDGKFPNVSMVVPEIEKHTLRLSLNVELLAGLAKAFGSDQVTLHLDPDGFSANGDKTFYAPPMLVTAGRPDSFGILMPCRPSGEIHLVDNEALKRLMATNTQPTTAEA